MTDIFALRRQIRFCRSIRVNGQCTSERFRGNAVDNSRPWQSGNFPEFDNVYPSLRTIFQNYRGVTVTRGETVLRWNISKTTWTMWKGNDPAAKVQCSAKNVHVAFIALTTSPIAKREWLKQQFSVILRNGRQHQEQGWTYPHQKYAIKMKQNAQHPARTAHRNLERFYR